MPFIHKNKYTDNEYKHYCALSNRIVNAEFAEPIIQLESYEIETVPIIQKCNKIVADELMGEKLWNR